MNVELCYTGWYKMMTKVCLVFVQNQKKMWENLCPIKDGMT
jgi:hypothetical protein